MRVCMQSIALGALLGTGGVLLVLLNQGTSRAEEDCAPLIQHKCGTCHVVSYVCPRIEKGKGSLYWKGIVKDMIKEGMVATEQEQDRITRCLASPDAKVMALCPKP